ncbi:MAG: ethanolamine utilization protein EutQ [Streptococcaceae bacterium]|jgi:ethanolamine utilization protein EutQ|nr:ethanolamine utilization protein EutQ [Streptococcaceae bacterium]
MTEINRGQIENLVRKIIVKALTPDFQKDSSGIIKVSLPQMEVEEKNRLDTGNPEDRVYCKDLFTLSESPRLGSGLMYMEETTFDWHLDYDEIDYVIDGVLDIIIEKRVNTVKPGELILIPKGSSIQFSVKDKARFVYVTYPADWANQ